MKITNAVKPPTKVYYAAKDGEVMRENYFTTFDICMTALVTLCLTISAAVIFSLLTKPAPEPTMYMFMGSGAICCVAVPTGLQCGKLTLQGPANYVNTGRPCEE
jgi:hypothetical protein